ncbi:hypothetical protein [Haladaptatus halobius]|uniref:hypothetical protein n=1 Tax=Haladaptatus halobius TaxID=2884875 RepID=UPI001D0B3366|nr:hypothetical protein [Haladaptatus halobius]
MSGASVVGDFQSVVEFDGGRVPAEGGKRPLWASRLQCRPERQYRHHHVLRVSRPHRPRGAAMGRPPADEHLRLGFELERDVVERPRNAERSLNL